MVCWLLLIVVDVVVAVVVKVVVDVVCCCCCCCCCCRCFFVAVVVVLRLLLLIIIVVGVVFGCVGRDNNNNTAFVVGGGVVVLLSMFFCEDISSYTTSCYPIGIRYVLPIATHTVATNDPSESCANQLPACNSSCWNPGFANARPPQRQGIQDFSLRYSSDVGVRTTYPLRS